jgi:hypothetical protein
MSTHSVEKHLHVSAEEYDTAIRTFVPHYEEMLQAGRRLAAESGRVKLRIGSFTDPLPPSEYDAVVVSSDARLRAMTFDRWAAFMATNGISADEATRHFAEWANEDRYFPVHEELGALERAGFAQPECFWRRGPMAVCGGVRSG